MFGEQVEFKHQNPFKNVWNGGECWEDGNRQSLGLTDGWCSNWVTSWNCKAVEV